MTFRLREESMNTVLVGIVGLLVGIIFDRVIIDLGVFKKIKADIEKRIKS